MWHPFDLWHSWRKMANGTSEKSSLWRPERIRKLCNSLKWQTKKSYDVQTHTNHAAFLSQDIPVHWCTVYSRIHVNCNRCYDSSWFQVKLQGPQGVIHGMREWGSSLFTPFDKIVFLNCGCFSHLPESPSAGFSWRFIQMKKCVFRYAATWLHEGSRALCIGKFCVFIWQPMHHSIIPSFPGAVH